MINTGAHRQGMEGTIRRPRKHSGGRVRAVLGVVKRLKVGGFTVSGDTGVFTLLDVGLGLQADRDSPTVRFIVKRDLNG